MKRFKEKQFTKKQIRRALLEITGRPKKIGRIFQVAYRKKHPVFPYSQLLENEQKWNDWNSQFSREQIAEMSFQEFFTAFKRLGPYPIN